MNQLEQVLQQCTVKVFMSPQAGWGTGFFVSPQRVLTCAHVIKKIKEGPITLQYQDKELEALVETFLPEPYDLALLKVSPVKDISHTYVHLDDEIRSRDPLYLFGYPDRDFPNGCPVTFNCEGLTGDIPPLIQFALGQVRPGMSGSPLLNQRTGKVCGIVKYTRDRSSDLGGGAVTTHSIFEQLPELRNYHQHNHPWIALSEHLTRAHNRNISRNLYLQATRPKYEKYLLEKVKNEIRIRLRQTLSHNITIKLNKELLVDEVKRPSDSYIKLRFKPVEKALSDLRMIDIFQSLEVLGRLLILGQPGAGKSISMLHLAKDLADLAENDIEAPIPVLLNLSSWKGQSISLENWLVSRMKLEYGVRKDIGKGFLRDLRLLPMLDGLDEVEPESQIACIHAINHWLDCDMASLHLVVSSRRSEYESLGEKLNLNGAIYLQSANLEQIKKYCRDLELPENVSSFLLNSNSIIFLSTPLFLNMAILAYLGISNDFWQATVSSEERYAYLFRIYLDQQLVKRPYQEQIYPKNRTPSTEKTIKWLTWISKNLAEENNFLIEELQPGKLNNRKLLYQYRVLLFLIGFVCILIPTYGVIAWLFNLDLLGMVILFAGLAIGVILDWYRPIRPVESLRISFKIPKSRLKVGIRNGMLFACVGWFLGGKFSSNFIAGSVAGAITAGLIAGIVGCLDKELVGPAIDDKILPNQGIKRSVQNSLIMGSIGGFLLTIIGILNQLYSENMSVKYIIGFSLIGLVSGILIGGGMACIQHLTLRIVLYLNGFSPWNYSRFLNFTSERMIIQRVGSRYNFVHKLLQQYFASNDALNSLQDFL